jgi:hypothetical protein
MAMSDTLTLTLAVAVWSVPINGQTTTATRGDVRMPQPIGPDHGDADNKEKFHQVRPATAIQGFNGVVTHCTFIRRFSVAFRRNRHGHFVRLARRRPGPWTFLLARVSRGVPIEKRVESDGVVGVTPRRRGIPIGGSQHDEVGNGR